MIDTNPFKKTQIIISLNKSSMDSKKINLLSIEIGYPDSKGEYLWKGSGRIYSSITKSFSKSIGRNGNQFDAIAPCSWNEFENNSKEFVFDFVKNSTLSKIKIKQQLFFENNNESESNEFEISESESFISIPYLDIKIREKPIGKD